jgi:hypothetical protein
MKGIVKVAHGGRQRKFVCLQSTCLRTLYGPRHFQSSFFEGHEVEIFEALSQTISPDSNSTF